jgi:TolB protein
LKGTRRWSPDGKYLAFDANVSANNWEVFVVGAAGSAVRQITDHPAADGVPAWSSDGKWVYFVSLRTGRAEVWKVAPSGGTPLQVTHNGGFAAFESPDGTTCSTLVMTVWPRFSACQ